MTLRMAELCAGYVAREHCSQSCANSRLQPTSKDAYHWRARKRRKGACEFCGSADGLHVHHIDRDRTNNKLSNLQTLCASCHLKSHWDQDRDKRMAAMRRNGPKECVICGTCFSPKQSRVQTCSPGCKAALLSRRTKAHYAKTVSA